MRTYNCLIDIGSEDKKAQDAKKSIIKRKLKFKDYENHLKATQFENKIYIVFIYIYIYINTKEFNLDRKRKILVVFDYVIADILSNEKFNQIIMELCIN